MKLLVTGGAGFIGSAFVRQAMATGSTELLNLDKLTYAGNLENLQAIKDNRRYSFVHGDICDAALVERLFAEYDPDAVVHFAAESHVDRSILSPDPVIRTNVNGTFTLLEAARRQKTGLFLHVSTDEVYGSLEEPLEADEAFPLRPSSPYSASKAGSDLVALSYYTTYRQPVIVTRASNNYGPHQFPEKFIPLMICNALDSKPLPIYGDGLQVRDWLYVDDHCRAIFSLLGQGRPGEIYNIGGNCSLPNREVVRRILEVLGKPESLAQTVTDRPGHDRRYALSSEKIMRQTGWRPQMDFETGLKETIDWYRSQPEWIARVRSGEYRSYYERNYAGRESGVIATGPRTAAP
jgi:dTDP-glucose 4,6-dehydratase